MIDFPLTYAEFRAVHFEQKPLHMPGALTERPLAWSDVDHLLQVLEPRKPVVRMFHHGQLPEQAYTEDVAEVSGSRRILNKPKFYDLMGKGATLVINWLEQHSVAARRLCLEVGRFARTRTSGNAYMSFAGDGTFGEHWDTHDVFVVQLIGRKRWRIFAPTWPLPLTYQTNEKSGHKCPTEPAYELIMEEGDVIYLPRGWWHHVIPLQAGSFHLAVGSYCPTMFDYIVQMSAKYLEHQVGARSAFSTESYREAVADALQQLGSALLDPGAAAAFEADWIGRERMNAELTLAALDPTGLVLPDAALVSLATFRKPALENGVMLVNGMQLKLEPTSLAIVAALRDRAWLRFDALCRELPGVARDVVSRTVLDLARHDIVTVQH